MNFVTDKAGVQEPDLSGHFLQAEEDIFILNSLVTFQYLCHEHQ